MGDATGDRRDLGRGFSDLLGALGDLLLALRRLGLGQLTQALRLLLPRGGQLPLQAAQFLGGALGQRHDHAARVADQPARGPRDIGWGRSLA
jgi:hypothetical protein